MSDPSTIYKLTNPEFTFSFDGQEHSVRKANLDMAVQYQAKAKELNDNKDAATELKLVAFCIWLVLKSKVPDLTYEQVLEKTPADIEPLECLTTLGFISPKKAEEARKISQAMVERVTSLTSKSSSSNSPTDSDGHPSKSES